MLSLDPLGPDDLGEARERALLAANGGRGVLAPYLRADVAARPLVLVHGIHGHPGELRALAERGLKALGLRPYLFVYDDVGRYVDRSGDDLARALAQLACHAPRPRVVIVAHSMGGIVARCALNSLTDPRWFPRFAPGRRRKVQVRGGAEAERAGSRLDARCVDDLAAIDLVAVDTPWAGFCDPRIDLRNLWLRERAWVDMVANSAVLTRLHATHLPPHVRVHHLEADQAGAGLAGDRIVTLGDLPDADLDRLQRAILGDRRALGRDRRRHNLLAALAGERSFPALAARVRARGVTAPATFRAELRRAVPRLAGSHTSVLDNTALFALLDALVVHEATEVSARRS